MGEASGPPREAGSRLGSSAAALLAPPDRARCLRSKMATSAPRAPVWRRASRTSEPVGCKYSVGGTVSGGVARGSVGLRVLRRFAWSGRWCTSSSVVCSSSSFCSLVDPAPAGLPTAAFVCGPAAVVALSRLLPRRAWRAFFVRAETVLCWHRWLVARRWTYASTPAGRPRLQPELRQLALRLARENPIWATTAGARFCASMAAMKLARIEFASACRKLRHDCRSRCGAAAGRLQGGFCRRRLPRPSCRACATRPRSADSSSSGSRARDAVSARARHG